MADAVVGSTQLDATKQNLIAGLVQRELKFSAMMASTLTDVSVYAVKGAKTISFPKFESFTVSERPSGTAGNATVIGSALDTLSLNIPAYLAYIIDPNDAVQSAVAVEEELAKRAATAHGRYFDQKLIAELLAVATDLGADTTISRDNILSMRKYLLDNQANLGACTLAVSTDQELELLKVDSFTRADVYGGAVIPAGVIGRVYGVPVMVHSGLPAGTAVMYAKEAVAYGFQLAPQVSEQMANEFGANAKRRVVDQLYGVKGLQIAQGSAGAGKSALAVKM